MVPDCTDVHTPRGPTPLKQPHIPSVWYINRRPRITEEVSRVAAPWAFRVVEGEEVDMGRFGGVVVLVEFAEVECFEVEEGERVAFGVGVEVDKVLGCCV